MNRSISNQIIHEYNVEKALYGNDNAFIHDFAFADIAPTLKRHNIFTDAELKSIQLLDTERERIDKMFFLIVYKNKNIEDFLNVLRVSYDWLAIGIEDDLKIFNDNSVDDEFLFQKIRQLRKEIPRHIDYNVHRCGFVSITHIYYFYINLCWSLDISINSSFIYFLLSVQSINYILILVFFYFISLHFVSFLNTLSCGKSSKNY